DAYAAHCVGDRELCGANGIARGGRQNVLPTGRGCVAVVEHHQHALIPVKHSVSHPAGQPVVPEASIAHDADRPLIAFARVESRSPSPSQTISHGCGTKIEGRKDRKQMAADIAAHVMWAQFSLHQLHSREDWALRAACTKRWRPWMHERFNRLWAWSYRCWPDSERQSILMNQLRRVALDKLHNPSQDRGGGVLARHGQHILAVHLGRQIRP